MPVTKKASRTRSSQPAKKQGMATVVSKVQAVASNVKAVESKLHKKIKQSAEEVKVDLRKEIKQSAEEVKVELRKEIKQSAEDVKRELRKEMQQMEHRIITDVTRHFDVTAERLLHDFRGALSDKVSLHDDTLVDHGQRITRMERHLQLAA